MFELKQLQRFAEDPHRICAVCHGEELSYRELVHQLINLGHYFQNTLQPGPQPVMIIGDKENLILSCLYAVLSIGHPYVMLSSSFPIQRMENMVDLCKPSLILDCSDAGITPFASPWLNAAELKRISRNDRFSDSEKAFEPYSWKNDEIMAYYFTSGSTGTPKGIRVSAGNFESTISHRRAFAHQYKMDRLEGQPVALNFSSYCFIASNEMLYFDICEQGAKVVAVDQDLLSDYQELIEVMIEANPTQFMATPTFLEICLKSERFNQNNFPQLKMILLGGGLLRNTVAEAFHQRFSAKLFAGYGLTEYTGSCLFCEITEEVYGEDGFASVGAPFCGAKAMIVDENGNECPEGQIGEMIVYGNSTVMGYLNADNSCFFYLDTGERAFRTGDLLYKKKDLFYFKGRKDGLVKVGGYRVELSDIEKNMLEIPEVSSVVVVPCRKDGEVRLLTAFIVPERGFKPELATTLSIRKQLYSKIQPYAIPQTFRYLERIPLNNNAKPDRVWLEKEASRIAFGNDKKTSPNSRHFG